MPGLRRGRLLHLLFEITQHRSRYKILRPIANPVAWRLACKLARARPPWIGAPPWTATWQPFPNLQYAHAACACCHGRNAMELVRLEKQQVAQLKRMGSHSPVRLQSLQDTVMEVNAWLGQHKIECDQASVVDVVGFAQATTWLDAVQLCNSEVEGWAFGIVIVKQPP